VREEEGGRKEASKKELDRGWGKKRDGGDARMGWDGKWDEMGYAAN
jgi:hypothetical protein